MQPDPDPESEGFSRREARELEAYVMGDHYRRVHPVASALGFVCGFLMRVLLAPVLVVLAIWKAVSR